MANVRKSAVKEAAPKKSSVTKTEVQSGLSVTVLGADGKERGTVTLSKTVFGAKVNVVLMNQAIRVYLANQRQGTHSTKTRGEVQGSTRKIYRQKGTGRARHGGIRAPIFVKGGIAHGPKPRDHSLTMSKKMRKLALFSALTSKLKDGQIRFVGGIEEVEPKTKNMAGMLKNLTLMDPKRKILFVLPKLAETTKEGNATLFRTTRNLTGITVTAADRLNTYDVLNNKVLLITKYAVESLEKHFLGGEK